MERKQIRQQHDVREGSVRAPRQGKTLDVPRAAYTVAQCCHAVGLSRTTFYCLIRAELIRPVRIGKRGIRIPASEIERFLAEGGVDNG